MALGDTLVLTVTYATVTSSSTQVLAANPLRRYLSIVNRDTGFVDLNFGVAAVVGQGIPLSAASALNGQGAGYEFTITGACDPRAVFAISTAGSHITIIEGAPAGG